MLPKSVPVLTGEAAERFEEQDAKPLTRVEKAFLKECYEIYQRHPLKD